MSKKTVTMPIPPDILDQLRQLKKETGVTQQRALERGLRFALRPRNRRLWTI